MTRTRRPVRRSTSSISASIRGSVVAASAAASALARTAGVSISPDLPAGGTKRACARPDGDRGARAAPQPAPAGPMARPVRGWSRPGGASPGRGDDLRLDGAVRLSRSALRVGAASLIEIVELALDSDVLLVISERFSPSPSHARSALVDDEVCVVATHAQCWRLAASMITAKPLAIRAAGKSSYPRDRHLLPQT